MSVSKSDSNSPGGVGVKAPARPWSQQFQTDVENQILYLDDRCGLGSLGRITAVAGLRLRPGYITMRVPARQLRRVLSMRHRHTQTVSNRVKQGQTVSSNKKAGQTVSGKVTSKPIPPVSPRTSQPISSQVSSRDLSNAERRARYKLDSAPMRDWWPVKGAVFTS